MRQYLRIGKIISLHGIKGEVKVFPTTDDIERFDDLEEFYIVDSDDADDSDFEGKEQYESLGVKYIKNTCVLKIKNFDSIEQSTKLIGKNIYVSRENAVKLKEDEYYVMDLIGLKVYAGDEFLGNVKEIMKTKIYSTLVIDYNKKELLVPLVSEFIEKIDMENSVIKIKAMEGLLWKSISWHYSLQCLTTLREKAW